MTVTEFFTFRKIRNLKPQKWIKINPIDKYMERDIKDSPKAVTMKKNTYFNSVLLQKYLSQKSITQQRGQLIHLFQCHCLICLETYKTLYHFQFIAMHYCLCLWLYKSPQSKMLYYIANPYKNMSTFQRNDFPFISTLRYIYHPCFTNNKFPQEEMVRWNNKYSDY